MIGIIILILFLIGIAIMICGFLFGKDSLGYIGMVMAFTLVFIGLMYGSIPETWTVETEHDIWSTDAPFGRYWVQTSGHGGLISFRYNSQLTESYTVKYLSEDNQVMTIIFPSDSEDHRVFLTDDKNTMTMTYFESFEKTALFGTSLEESRYEIYIPDPKLFEAE